MSLFKAVFIMGICYRQIIILPHFIDIHQLDKPSQFTIHFKCMWKTVRNGFKIESLLSLMLFVSNVQSPLFDSLIEWDMNVFLILQFFFESRKQNQILSNRNQIYFYNDATLSIKPIIKLIFVLLTKNFIKIFNTMRISWRSGYKFINEIIQIKSTKAIICCVQEKTYSKGYI